MRESKFRVYNKDTKEMYYSDKDYETGEGLVVWCIDASGIYVLVPELIDSCPGGACHKQEIEYRRPDQVRMEYTGIQDGNDKEIYEGDIVEFKNQNFKVIYKQDGYHIGWCATDKNEFAYIHIWYDNLKVIGNIYENPELLEIKQ